LQELPFPSRFQGSYIRPHLDSRARSPGMLWSAYYPCRYLRLSSHFWTRQCPRFFHFPVRSARFGLCGRLSMSNSRRFLAYASQPFSSQFLELFLTAHNSNHSVERLGELRAAPSPVGVVSLGTILSLGLTGPPSLTPLGAVPRCLTTLTPATSCVKSPARFPSGTLYDLSYRIFSSQLLLEPPARLAFLSRDSATCFRYARFPCPYRDTPSLE
jgi:hypothetical protein